MSFSWNKWELGSYWLMFFGWLVIIKAKISICLLSLFHGSSPHVYFSGKKAKIVHIYWIWPLRVFLEAPLQNFNLVSLSRTIQTSQNTSQMSSRHHRKMLGFTFNGYIWFIFSIFWNNHCDQCTDWPNPSPCFVIPEL